VDSIVELLYCQHLVPVLILTVMEKVLAHGFFFLIILLSIMKKRQDSERIGFVVTIQLMEKKFDG